LRAVLEQEAGKHFPFDLLLGLDVVVDKVDFEWVG